jgi:hypothetical protein
MRCRKSPHAVTLGSLNINILEPDIYIIGILNRFCTTKHAKKVKAKNKNGSYAHISSLGPCFVDSETLP